jgi:type I restriction enzyme S subunit
MSSESLEVWELPEGWEWRRLSEGDVAEVIMGQSPPGKTYNEKGEGLPFFQGKADFGNLYPTPRRWCTAPKKIAEPGDVLISVRAPVGPTNLCAETCCIGRGLAAIRPGHRTDSKFLLFALRAMEPEIIQRGQGSTFSAITKRDLLSCQIPLPPLDEQRRIVARIEELFARIEEARRLRAAADQDAEELMTAELAEVFPDPENELPKGWHLKHVAEISEKPQYGYTQPAQDEPIGPKFLRITDIQDGQVNWETVPFCLCAEKELEKYRLEPGDIVFARSGATTGKTFLVEECPEAVFASYLIRLKVRGVIVPAYVYWFFQSPYYWRQVKPRGAAQPNMNARILSGLQVPIPGTPAEQHRIVEYLDGLQAQVAELKQLQAGSAVELEWLSGAVLARAFRGEL